LFIDYPFLVFSFLFRLGSFRILFLFFFTVFFFILHYSYNLFIFSFLYTIPLNIFFFSFIFLFFFANVYLFSQEQTLLEVKLPSEKSNYTSTNKETQRQFTRSLPWQKFLDAHGSWSVQWNEASQTPHRAFGKSIAIAGYSFITKTNVEQAARTFLSQNNALFHISNSELRLRRADVLERKWYVSFAQYSNGIEVLLTDIELRIH